MKKHARFGPSSLAALSKCLRFRYSDVDEEAADEGTALHAACETGNMAGLDDEQRNAVQAALDYVEAVKGGKPDDWHHLKEVRIELEDLTFGTSDVVLVHKTLPEAHVMDEKFTRIEGDHDMQLRAYAAGLVEMSIRNGVLADHEGNVKLILPRQITKVTTHVVAPRTRTIDVKEYEASTLLAEVRAEIEELYERIDDPFLPPTPHESLCSKCARAARCPALGAVAVVAARGIGLPMPEEFNPEAMVSVEDRARAHTAANALENWAKAVKSLNNEFAKLGGEIPGYKLRTRSTGAKLPKEYTALALDMLEEHGFNRAVMLEHCSLTLGELAKTHALNTGTTEADAKEQIRNILSDWVTEGETSFLAKAKKISDQALLEQLNA
jgi:hypothetical protein